MEDRRQQILDAGLAIADEKGLEAVSMRAVAERAGVTAMALYPHVASKADLLDGMVGRVLSELIPRVEPGQDWRQRLRILAQAGRKLAHQHPWGVTLLFTRPSVTPDSTRVVDLFYAFLLDAGIPPAQVPRLERLVSTFLLGFAASEVGGRFDPGDLPLRERRALLRARLPGHKAVLPWLAPVDWAAEFEADLDDLIRLIETVAAGGQTARQP